MYRFVIHTLRQAETICIVDANVFMRLLVWYCEDVKVLMLLWSADTARQMTLCK